MKCLLQRVMKAAVEVDGAVVSEIGEGLLVFVGIEPADSVKTVTRMTERLLSYRVFADETGKMNLNVCHVSGAILLVPQFTLAADTARGNRPNFSSAAPPELARKLCGGLAGSLRAEKLTVAEGKFGAHMHISSVNDGPVTFLIEA